MPNADCHEYAAGVPDRGVADDVMGADIGQAVSLLFELRPGPIDIVDPVVAGENERVHWYPPFVHPGQALCAVR